VNGTERKICGSIAYTSADNLGAQALGGFKESCSAHRPCRYCLGTLEEMKSKVQNVIDIYRSVFGSFP
jgi:hypothetical protein